MKLELEIYGSLCATGVFKINGVTADSTDFGEQGDHAPFDAAEDYACGDMQFNGVPHTEEVLKKYSITIEEYSKIVEELEEGLSFGSCGWCV